jgi:Family of unknown function (DUF6494)
MDEDRFNMAIRKFLKEVGVTSQREIEKAVRAAKADGRTIRLTMTLTSDDLPLKHVVETTIEVG